MIANNKNYTLITENDNSATVVENYIPIEKRIKTFQTEEALENEFIKQLQNQAYEYVQIKNEHDLIANLRKQIEKLNSYQFTDNEWDGFYKKEIANENDDIIKKTMKIQDGDGQLLLTREDGSCKNITIIDKQNIHNNSLQVINQYENEGNDKNRYDVTILVNGLPLVHVELKRRGINLKEAFNQINRYQKESFWSNSGLYNYVQIFVISNGTLTKYYSNTTRHLKIKDDVSSKITASDSFEFTSFWADQKNNAIEDITDFTSTFFSKHTILNVLTKYCVLNTEQKLLVLRPYQITAVEKIINRIEIANNNKFVGTIKAGGYIWHTTGSGKTLTSFKAAKLIAEKNTDIDKVIFVVDRQDLDYQTMKEYDKFEKGAANATKNTTELAKKIFSIQDNSKIIITTIQKLNNFINQQKEKKDSVFQKKIVFIFDECHRSQFGIYHTNIVKSFKNYYIFGFTGTPIFSDNSSKPELLTTEGCFGEKLHTYSIVNAIKDKNVLPFRVEYNNTIKANEEIENKKVLEIDTENALLSPIRIKKITEYILKNFSRKTSRNTYDSSKGFNSLFCVSSIEGAKKYYEEFKKQQDDKPLNERLKITTIFSYVANENEADLSLVDEDNESVSNLDKTSKEFLKTVIKDYNEQFKVTNSIEDFKNFYKDVSQNLKEKKLDLVIVVNMFLTGFDAPKLNTLWVDKNLKSHGLLQAFSRTNRILNTVKDHGNIVCFRNLEENTNLAIALFGNSDAHNIVILKPFKDFYDNEKEPLGYKQLVEKLIAKNITSESSFKNENEEKEFVSLWGKILKLKNTLKSFDEFSEEKAILTPRQFQDYNSYYQNIHEKTIKSNKENINEDLEFSIELIKQEDINIGFILELVLKYQKDQSEKNRNNITSAVASSPAFRNKRDLIDNFLEKINNNGKDDAYLHWNDFIKKQKIKEINTIIEQNNLHKEETIKLMNEWFENKEVNHYGDAITKIFSKQKVSRFKKDSDYVEKKQNVLALLDEYFEKFFDLSNEHIED